MKYCAVNFWERIANQDENLIFMNHNPNFLLYKIIYSNIRLLQLQRLKVLEF